MSDRFMYCYLSSWSRSRASAFIDDMDVVGLKIANPVSGRVTALSADEWDAGRIIDTQLSILLEWMSLDDRKGQNFQFWIDGSRDVVFRIARRGPIFVQDFHLDGLENSIAREVVRAVVGVLTWANWI